MRFQDGYLVVGHWGRAPIRVHWSMPLGAFIMCGFAFAPGAWLGFLVLILVHEVGHAAMARAFGCEVYSINAHAIGGNCEMSAAMTRREHSMIAWGGVLAQLGLLVLAFVLGGLLPRWGFFMDFLWTMTRTNMILIALNLLPVRPFDGAEAWKVFQR